MAQEHDDKAKELVEKFIDAIRTNKRAGSYPLGDKYFLANQCVLICVDEILSHIEERKRVLHDTTDFTDFKYWQQVKQSIQKLTQKQTYNS